MVILLLLMATAPREPRLQEYSVLPDFSLYLQKLVLPSGSFHFILQFDFIERVVDPEYTPLILPDQFPLMESQSILAKADSGFKDKPMDTVKSAKIKTKICFTVRTLCKCGQH